MWETISVIDYNNPNRWIILQYRPGSGGKFLSAALMSLDRVAHWDRRVEQGELSFEEWAATQWQWQHTEHHKWLAYEPLHEWDIRFFSRTFARGEDLSLSEYNKLISETASEYFKQVWQSDKLILDFIHKPTLPLWWEDSYCIKLDAIQECSIYRKLLLSKIYPYNQETGMGMFMMDHPFPENASPNARIYKNQYEFGPFETEDKWYQHIWENDTRLNFKIEQPDIMLDDLLNFDRLEKYVMQVATDLNSSYNPKNLRCVWDVWMEQNKNLLTFPKYIIQ